MKKICTILVMSGLFACHSNENAENKPNDLDRTKNNDTSVVPKDSTAVLKTDSTDTAQHKQHHKDGIRP